VLFSLSLVTWLGFRGLALATSLAAIGNGALLVWFLHRRLNGIEGRRLAIVAVKIVTAGAAMAVAAWSIHYSMTTWVTGDRVVAQGIRLAAAIGGGLMVLAATAKLLKIAEFHDAFALVGSRFGTKRADEI